MMPGIAGMVARLESVRGSQPTCDVGLAMTELIQDRGSATRLRSGLVQLHTILAASLAWRDPGGAATVSQAIMPSSDCKTFEKCVRKADHCSVAPTCQRLTARPRRMTILLADLVVMAVASGACSRANRRRTASGRDISAPLYRAANCIQGTTNQPTQNAASATGIDNAAKIQVVASAQAGRTMVNSMQATAKIPKTLGRLHPVPGTHNHRSARKSAIKLVRSTG